MDNVSKESVDIIATLLNSIEGKLFMLSYLQNNLKIRLDRAGDKSIQATLFFNGTYIDSDIITLESA